MILTREGKEKLVLDLYNEGKSTREIAQIAHMSFRDISFIIDKKEKEQESKEGQTRQGFLSTQAYKLFSEGKSPVQVAITLNIREPEVARFYVEYWKLRQLYSLNKIYEELKDDIGPFVNLYTLAKVARMDTPSVIRVLEIANNDLPAVELRYERSKKEAATLEYEKENSAREFQQVNNQIIMMCKTRDSTRLDCEKEMERLRHLQQQRMKQEALVKHFENNNEEYINIVKTIKDKLHNTLSDVKVFLQLALLSLTESMRYDPDKYGSLIYYNSMSSTKDNSNQHYSLYMHRQQQPPPYDYDFEDCKAMLLDEAEKLFSSLTKRIVDEVINEVVSKASSSAAASLPPLPLDDNQQQQNSSLS